MTRWIWLAISLCCWAVFALALAQALLVSMVFASEAPWALKESVLPTYSWAFAIMAVAGFGGGFAFDLYEGTDRPSDEPDLVKWEFDQKGGES